VFALQFPASEILALAERFGYQDDPRVRAAGAAAAARGYYRRAEFLLVCAWKSVRSRPLVQANTPAAVRAATFAALGTDVADAARMEALLRLEGVGLPTASTLLHFAFPADFPILDVRVLEALGQPPRSGYTVAYWVAYAEACRALAAEHGVSLRTLDKALWQWSKERAVSPARPGRSPAWRGPSGRSRSWTGSDPGPRGGHGAGAA
jgi:hypothetical protein